MPRSGQPRTLAQLNRESARVARAYQAQFADAYELEVPELTKAGLLDYIKEHPVISGVVLGFLLSRLT